METRIIEFDELSWAKLYSLYPSLRPGSLDHQEAKRSFPVHCYLPLCIGYKNPVNFIHLNAIIKNIIEKGFSFTILLAPKDEATLVNFWKDLETCKARNEVPTLQLLSTDNFKHIDEFREEAAWKKASDTYEELLKDERKKPIIEAMLQKDTENKKRQWGISGTDAEKHILLSVTDCISLKTDVNKPINIIMSNESITNVMSQVMRLLGEASPLYIKPHCVKRPVLKQQVEPGPYFLPENKVVNNQANEEMQATDLARKVAFDLFRYINKDGFETNGSINPDESNKQIEKAARFVGLLFQAAKSKETSTNSSPKLPAKASQLFFQGKEEAESVTVERPQNEVISTQESSPTTHLPASPRQSP